MTPYTGAAATGAASEMSALLAAAGVAVLAL